jgi:glycosyltransferase involved in cell wall biosynthesis
VSVIVPTYNRAAYLPATLATLTHQTLCAPYEVIVVDDGSTDATREAVAPYTRCNVRYERIEHAGPPAPINRGLELARGEYVMLANDHDLYAQETLAALSEALDAHPSALLAVSDVVLVTPDATRDIATYSFSYCGLVEGRRFLTEQLLPGIGSIAPHNMFRRDALRCEGLDASYGVSCDVELWLRLASRGDVVHVPETLVRARDRDPESSHYLHNHEVVRQALRAKRAYIPADLAPAQRAAIEADWRHRVDKSAAVSLWRALEAGCPEVKPAIRDLARSEGTRAGGLAIEALTRLPDRVSLTLLGAARRLWGER